MRKNEPKSNNPKVVMKDKPTKFAFEEGSGMHRKLLLSEHTLNTNVTMPY
jgi:hypothetical protein